MPKSTNYIAKKTDENGLIDYTEEDNAVWRDLYHQQQPSVLKYAAKPYLDGLVKLNLPADRVPQCREVSETLLPLTAWSVEPVPALIGFERFFKMLSERKFPAASFIRSRKDFDYIEEPDIFHEIYGHTPLLADERFAEFAEFIGLTGVRCSMNEYSWLMRIWWFTVEFGLIKQQAEIKALGSGLASSPTELVYSIEDTSVIRKPFDIIDILRTPYRIDINQPIYFVLDSVDQLLEFVQRDLMKDIKTAQALGLHSPVYENKKQVG